MGCKTTYDYDDIVSDFCESYLWGHPEYINSFTSLVFSFLMFYLILMNEVNSVITLFTVVVFLTGIGSFMFHWTGWNLFASTDVNPLFLAPCLGMYITFNAIFYKHFQLNRGKYVYYKWSRFFTSFISMSWFFIVLTLRENDDISLPFEWYFIPPCICVGLGLMWMRFVSHEFQFAEFTKLRRYFYVACACAIVAIVTNRLEPDCRDNKVMRYFQTHGIWHITMAYTTYLLVVILVFIHHLNTARFPHFRRHIIHYTNQYMKAIDHGFSLLLPSVVTEMH